jgi:hypothetical protein
LRAVYRAIIRGGTFAVLAQCIQRFGCGKTLFVNGVAWPDAAATPDQSILDIDVATDGRVLVISKEYGDAGEALVMRRLSPSRQILLERRFPTGAGAFIWKAAVLPADSSALVFETAGPTYYLSFQSPDLENWLAMIPAPGNILQTLGRNGTWVGAAAPRIPRVSGSESSTANNRGWSTGTTTGRSFPATTRARASCRWASRPTRTGR